MLELVMMTWMRRAAIYNAYLEHGENFYSDYMTIFQFINASRVWQGNIG